MAAGVDVAEGVDVDVGVDLRGFHARVAEQFLDVADVGPAAVHVGRAGVAEEVAGAGLVDAALDHEFLEPVAKRAGGDARAVAAEEQRGLSGQVGEVRTCIGQKTVEPGGGARANGQHPAFAALAPADGERLTVRIVVAEVEAGHFGAADAGGVEEFEDRAVAQAEAVAGVGRLKQKGEFGRRERFWKLARLFAGQVEVRRRVGRDDPVAAQPGEEPADAAQPCKLGVDRQRPAAVWVAVAMVTIQVFKKS